jgi:transposase
MTPSTAMPGYRLFVGADIAAQSVTLATQALGGAISASFTIEQTPSAYASLRTRLLGTGVAAAEVLVGLEATGTYWLNLAVDLHQAGFAVSVINPAQAHHFAQALLKRAKTDALDAQLLTQLAAQLQPPPWTPPPAIYADLQQRLAQRDDLIGIRQQVRNQRHALSQRPHVVTAVRQRMDELIATLTAQIKTIEAELAELAQRSDPWIQSITHRRTIKGVGLITAAWLVVTTLNFSLCTTPDEATAYAGLAPHPHTSGSSVRGRARVGHGGNARLRTALYMATLSAARTNLPVKAFYDRLKQAGKRPKVARCAAARKLLHIAWAVATKGQSFDPHYAQRPKVEPLAP